jgi:hypothetical protein
MNTAQEIRDKCNAIAGLLIEKNAAYGDSALQPPRIMARGNATDLIRVRIDDKLARLKHQPTAFNEDAVLDLTGYLVLLMIATDRERQQTHDIVSGNVTAPEL